ncbi:hypothetical protein L4D06_23270 [Enterovibrio makurazakiensis]|uniref:hypothetical protein n=1 Tax=Enterovibrio makurazakiensis TaxID=2910232 RepID=UPI003D215499
MDLEKSWKITIVHLKAARSTLLEHMLFAKANEVEKEFDEYLEHNELELAMNALDYVGTLSKAPDEFWFNLELAALNMGLVVDAERYNRIRNT